MQVNLPGNPHPIRWDGHTEQRVGEVEHGLRPDLRRTSHFDSAPGDVGGGWVAEVAQDPAAVRQRESAVANGAAATLQLHLEAVHHRQRIRCSALMPIRVAQHLHHVLHPERQHASGLGTDHRLQCGERVVDPTLMDPQDAHPCLQTQARLGLERRRSGHHCVGAA